MAIADSIPAFDGQRMTTQVIGRQPFPAIRPIDLSPPTGDSEPQTFALASLTG